MRFALDVFQFGPKLPGSFEGNHVRGQLFRAASGTAANYRSACRGKSKPDFIAKLGTVIEEADEAEFWLELIGRANLAPAESVRSLQQEAGELVAIFTQAQKTAKNNLQTRIVCLLLFFLLSLLFTSAFSFQHSAL
jgi:four helix bundle protein